MLTMWDEMGNLYPIRPYAARSVERWRTPTSGSPRPWRLASALCPLVVS